MAQTPGRVEQGQGPRPGHLNHRDRAPTWPRRSRIRADKHSADRARQGDPRLASRQAAAGIQQTLLMESSSNATRYNVNGGTLGAGTLLDCVVPEISLRRPGRNDPGRRDQRWSPVPRPSPQPARLAVRQEARPARSRPATWTALSNGSYYQSELIQTTEQQPGPGSAYLVQFPEIVSIGCHTTSATPITSCQSGDKNNSYSRQLAVLKPTAPLQAVEGENNVTISGPEPGHPGQPGAH